MLGLVRLSCDLLHLLLADLQVRLVNFKRRLRLHSRQVGSICHSFHSSHLRRPLQPLHEDEVHNLAARIVDFCTFHLAIHHLHVDR